MKIRLPSFQALAGVRIEDHQMWKNLGLLVETLRITLSGGLDLTDNISHDILTVPMEHGVQKTVPHSLGRVPRVAMVANGRVEFLETVGRTAVDVTVKAKLLGTVASTRDLNTLTQTVNTPDAAFFREGDVVLIAGVTNTVSRVSVAQISLDRQVVGGSALAVSLGVEEIKLLVL